MPEPLINEPLYDASPELAGQIDWVRGIAAKTADAVAGDHSVVREMRRAAAYELSCAFEEICFDIHARFDREAFLRRCGTPTLREKA